MKISVALPTYNGEKFLISLLDSIAAQTYSINELVICDDASKDQTLDLVRDFSRSTRNFEIKLLTNRYNLGLIKNVSKAIKHCAGQFIFLADQDDIWEKYKVETFLREFGNGKKEYLISNMSVIDAFGSNNGVTWVEYCEKIFGFSSSYHMNGCAVGATKSFFQSCLPIPPGKGHDVWFAYCARRLKTRKFINEPLMKYRVHETGQTSKNFIDLIQKGPIEQISKKEQQEMRIYDNDGKSIVFRKIKTIIFSDALLTLFLTKLTMHFYFLWVKIKWKTLHQIENWSLK